MLISRVVQMYLLEGNISISYTDTFPKEDSMQYLRIVMLVL